MLSRPTEHRYTSPGLRMYGLGLLNDCTVRSDASGSVFTSAPEGSFTLRSKKACGPHLEPISTSVCEMLVIVTSAASGTSRVILWPEIVVSTLPVQRTSHLSTGFSLGTGAAKYPQPPIAQPTSKPCSNIGVMTNPLHYCRV